MDAKSVVDGLWKAAQAPRQKEANWGRVGRGLLGLGVAGLGAGGAYGANQYMNSAKPLDQPLPGGAMASGPEQADGMGGLQMDVKRQQFGAATPQAPPAAPAPPAEPSPRANWQVDSVTPREPTPTPMVDQSGMDLANHTIGQQRSLLAGGGGPTMMEQLGQLPTAGKLGLGAAAGLGAYGLYNLMRPDEEERQPAYA